MRQAGCGTFLATGGYAGVDPQPAYATISLGKAGLRTAVSLMHDELKAHGVHAASVTVAGAIAPGTPLDPDLIADAYWTLHSQQAPDWTAETYFDGQLAHLPSAHRGGSAPQCPPFVQPYGDYYGSWRAMEKLHAEGAIQAIGLSNFDPDRLVDLIDHNEITPGAHRDDDETSDVARERVLTHSVSQGRAQNGVNLANSRRGEPCGRTVGAEGPNVGGREPSESLTSQARHEVLLDVHPVGAQGRRPGPRCGHVPEPQRQVLPHPSASSSRPACPVDGRGVWAAPPLGASGGAGDDYGHASGSVKPPLGIAAIRVKAPGRPQPGHRVVSTGAVAAAQGAAHL
jgi:hypothetical protein